MTSQIWESETVILDPRYDPRWWRARKWEQLQQKGRGEENKETFIFWTTIQFSLNQKKGFKLILIAEYNSTIIW